MSMLEPISAAPLERRKNRERRKLKRSNARGAGLSVAHDGDVKTAFVGDVSASGMRLSLDRPLNIGEKVEVNFGHDVTLTGRVVWVRNADCGIEFDEPVDGTVAHLPAVSERRSAKGLAMPLTKSRFREGLGVTVVLPDCERKAVLHWTDDDTASFTLKG